MKLTPNFFNSPIVKCCISTSHGTLGRLSGAVSLVLKFLKSMSSKIYRIKSPFGVYLHSLTNRATNRLTNRPTNQPTNQPNNNDILALFSRVHATLYVTMSVGRSVGWSVGRSVQNHFTSLRIFWHLELK